MVGQVEIEARTYGPDSTPEEIAAIQSRLSLVDGNVLLWRELPVVSTFSVDVCYDHVEALCRAHGCRLMVVDATTGGRPDAEVRKRIQERVSRLGGQIDHIAVIIGTNPLIKVAARFIQAKLPMSLSMHATIEEAMEAIRRVERR